MEVQKLNSISLLAIESELVQNIDFEDIVLVKSHVENQLYINFFI